MKMTFDDYIQNPMGRKNMVISNRNLLRDSYKNKLDQILLREVGKVKYTLYSFKDRYFIHFKIPSEVVPKFYYDTVVEFYNEDPALTTGRSLKKYNVKFYSNDPSFVYTFAYAFLENDLFIRELIPRMSKKAIKKVASERNPKREVGYVKSIYFAYLLVIKYNLFNKIEFDTYGKGFNKRAILKEIMPAEEKIQKRKDEGAKISKKKSRENKKEKKERDRLRKADMTALNTMSSDYAKPAKRTRTVTRTKTAKRSNRAKRI